MDPIVAEALGIGFSLDLAKEINWKNTLVQTYALSMTDYIQGHKVVAVIAPIVGDIY